MLLGFGDDVRGLLVIFGIPLYLLRGVSFYFIMFLFLFIYLCCRGGDGEITNHFFKKVRNCSYSQGVDKGILLNVRSLLFLIIFMVCSYPFGGIHFSLIL